MKSRILLLITPIIFLSFMGFAQTFTPGEVSFTVKTVTDNGNYAPRHVLAIWVEDANGFVKTRKVMANQRKQYLYTWKVASNYNEVDAITGPTLNTHQTHTITWDCRDLDGTIVPDGDYHIYAEFTEKHAQGPVTMITFTKGTDAQTLDPADEDNFIDMHLEYTAFLGIEDNDQNNMISLQPNPASDILSINGLTSDTQIKVFDLSGKMIREFKMDMNTNQVNVSDYAPGIYFLSIQEDQNLFSKKLIIQ